MRKAFFLDRDGVINEAGRVNSVKDLTILDGVPEAVRLLNERDYDVFVCTNQGAVGLGYLSQKDLDDIHTHMLQHIEQQGGRIVEVQACVHKPQHGCLCRKPKPGMLTRLMEKYQIDPKESYMVGDRDVDMIAGKRAGVRTVLIGTKPIYGVKPDYRFPSLLEAVEEITKRQSRT